MVASSTVELVRKLSFNTKIRVGKYYEDLAVKVVTKDGKPAFRLSFGYNPAMIALIKTTFEGRRWNPQAKVWEIPMTERNIFRLEYLQGKYCSHDPYRLWANDHDHSEQILAYAKERGVTLMAHQVDMINLVMNNHWVLLGAEMGLGKTLVSILALEMLGSRNTLWFGPKSALVAARLEFNKWNTTINPIVMTYEAGVKFIKEAQITPDAIVCDESSRLKNEKTQRTQAIRHITSAIRTEKGWENTRIILLTGTPNPKHPTDLHSQIETIQPGFINEADVFSLRERLGHTFVEDQIEGIQAFTKLRTWKDSEEKCKHCGAKAQHPNHGVYTSEHATHEKHTFEAGVNEVKNFGKRLKGIMGVWYKRDCLDLPAKRYQTIQVEPTQEILNLAKTIVQTTLRGADALIKLRTLSDGFLYEEQETEETDECEFCAGDQCEGCNGTGQVKRKIRVVKSIACPKLDVLTDILEQHEEVQRLNVYAGFQGSVDRIEEHCRKLEWHTIRADGRGWRCSLGEMSNDEMIKIYQSDIDERIVFIGQPGAAGMGLTLTASPTTFFYSNDFNPENRMQAEDRGHRPGMDMVRGGQIIDIIHLPSDLKVIQSLKQSRQLQAMSIEELRNIYQ